MTLPKIKLTKKKFKLNETKDLYQVYNFWNFEGNNTRDCFLIDYPH